MSLAARHTPPSRSLRRREFRGRPLGQILVSSGRLSQASLDFALDLQTETGGPLGQILVAHHFISPEEVSEALAAQSGHGAARRSHEAGLTIPGDPKFWIRAGLMPWSRTKTGWKVATSNPREGEKYRPELESILGKFDLIWASPDQIQSAQTSQFQSYLCHQAEFGLPTHWSCRDYEPRKAILFLAAIMAVGMMFLLLAGTATSLFHVVLGLSLLGLFGSIGLKAAILSTTDQTKTVRTPKNAIDIWPTISVMVPLFKETKIAERLIERLKMLDYPRSHLDVILLLEECDPKTRDVRIHTALPSWMRIIEVPEGRVQTKPRAMNYALPFCRGDIIGIYDAEDAPEPDQLSKVAVHFAQSPPEVVCVQGRLDFYNTHSNWMARCFTIEYASWFRVILPRLITLGGLIPLGGTTLFFRKSALLELGGWDAHNVTEDADLGVRLARAGYRCEMLDSTTFEEANNKPLAWIKQRSRWLKGYLITYLVHMRSPLRLWRDLGPRKFLLFQLLFLNTLLGFSLAPVFWVLWGISLGLIGPHDLGLATWVYWVISIACVGSFAIEALIGTIAVSKSGHIALGRWVITTWANFHLGSVAMYKGAWEMIAAPFYWDKTDHG